MALAHPSNTVIPPPTPGKFQLKHRVNWDRLSGIPEAGRVTRVVSPSCSNGSLAKYNLPVPEKKRNRGGDVCTSKKILEGRVA